ncbi:MAG: diaminopimelate decarboxylase [Chloroflexota bacterium]
MTADRNLLNPSPFRYVGGQLVGEGVALADIASAVGTPAYVYSQAELLRRANAYRDTAATLTPRSLVCYAVKANGNPTLLRLLAAAGLGADVTSGGELFLALHAGFPPDKIIFSGVGKTRAEIEMALTASIRALHVESAMELEVVAETAASLGRVASIGVRVNPDVPVDTHAYISTGQRAHKFGVSPEQALQMIVRAVGHLWLRPVGLAAHIGSQITELGPFVAAADKLVELAGELAALGIGLPYIDVGGGLGIYYGREEAPEPTAWVTAVARPVVQAGYEVVMEPGRSIVGPAGALVTQVLYTKTQGDKTFVITDAGMNDLIRPALYQAYHPIVPVRQTAEGTQGIEGTGGSSLSSLSSFPLVDVVGPVCETGDWLARDRPLPPVRPGDLLAVLQAGAYGFAMSSNYNGRLRAAEVLVDGGQFRVIRGRQRLEDLLK